MSAADSFPVLPAHDGATFPMPAVAGEQTAPFVPEWTAPLQALPWQPQPGQHAARHRAPDSGEALCDPPDDNDPCRCGMCPEPDPDCKDALLSCAPGVVTRMSRERVRNGQWDDIPAFTREAGLRVNRPAVDNLARIRANSEHGHLDMDMLFDRTPPLHAHQSLGAGLRLAERVLAAQLAAWEPWRPGLTREKPRTIAEMGAAVDVTAAIAAERLAAA